MTGAGFQPRSSGTFISGDGRLTNSDQPSKQRQLTDKARWNVCSVFLRASKQQKGSEETPAKPRRGQTQERLASPQTFLRRPVSIWEKTTLKIRSCFDHLRWPKLRACQSWGFRQATLHCKPRVGEKGNMYHLGLPRGPLHPSVQGIWSFTLARWFQTGTALNTWQLGGESLSRRTFYHHMFVHTNMTYMYVLYHSYHLPVRMHSEKCVIRQFHHCMNVTECICANLGGVASRTRGLAAWFSLWLLGYRPVQSVTVQKNKRLNQAREEIMQSRDVVNRKGMRLLTA